MTMVGILCIVILTTITVVMGTQTRSGFDGPTMSSDAEVGHRVRRRQRRSAGTGHVRPQYLPAVARARILRTQVPRLGIGTARRRIS